MSTTTRILQTVAVAAALAALAAPVSAQYYRGDHALRFRAGLFEPDGSSQYWYDANDLFTGGTSDFQDTIGGIDYRMGLGGGSHLSLLFSASGYEGQSQRTYRNFVDNQQNEIRSRATLDISSVTAGLMFQFAPQAPVRPYVGAGGGYYFWQLKESGDFIDFGSSNTIFHDRFKDDGQTLGYYWLAGLAVPLSPDWSLFAEGRWHKAEDTLNGDFAGLGKLDLSGREISAGFAWSF